MRKLVLIILLLPALVFAQNYTLGSGDIISIHVYDEPSLSFDDILLTDEGTLALPFVGLVSAKNKTVDALRKDITKKLQTGGYIKYPNVVIRLKKYRDFYVSGAVIRPGNYEFSPYMTLRKALAVAGGLDRRASEAKIFIIRANNPNKENEAKMDDQINPGDIIIAREGFF